MILLILVISMTIYLPRWGLFEGQVTRKPLIPVCLDFTSGKWRPARRHQGPTSQRRNPRKSHPSFTKAICVCWLHAQESASYSLSSSRRIISDDCPAPSQPQPKPFDFIRRPKSSVVVVGMTHLIYFASLFTLRWFMSHECLYLLRSTYLTPLRLTRRHVMTLSQRPILL